MRVLASVCLAALLVLALALSLRIDGPSTKDTVDAKATGGVPFNVKVEDAPRERVAWGTYGQPPPTWIPSDAERENDRGASLTWVPTDAERENDRGAFLSWIPTDAEREDDRGAFLSWIATDAEREDDIGVPVNGSSGRRQ